ncbi:lactose-specific PTS transporter subunit EIIC [Staphylococcus chromogenes]|uniref:PTS system lactose-specific EIICB component n=2 Tax=Staphylococcus chromogenes TaxID=46126 RepID=A0ABD5ASF2_STACR|nr:lactose-specific PTS transporter subunit EIIC [Staphylococcus chromogenes]MBV5137479.1 lactose-specific PTS transporter subunit EIIC [Staphylococcus chromogenes]MBV5191385.1 lactose-specific PTS transporter subunit EIIC [Staphylococcus chromogenes]MBW3132348.1 lactose-specific PTS transporter subunit EIIC [Staphylococcus chromogenes]MBW6088258.1 lactose-specific PTS transporter subunit EIIC [Staphylococcus chromogenes]MCD9059845.1 lactose-specific PTS transporter subunit EIIC [Staphylococcu
MMNKLIGFIEKGKPFFEKLSRNIYLRAIRDGFISAMPVILFSSIFLLIAYVPNIFGFTWPKHIEAAIMKPYGYTMGVVGLLVAGTTAKALTDAYNRRLESTNQINFISTMLASICGFLFLAANPLEEGGFANAFMGTKGLLTAFLSAFVTVIIYNICVKNNVTIKMPKEVPPNISQVFKDLIPFTLVILVLYGLDLTVRAIINTNVAEAIVKLFEPLFTAADGYVGITLIFGAFALFWFVGIHGPSIVEPAIAAITYANIETNFKMLQAGEHADKILTPGTQMFIVTMGGTGATLVVPFIFMWLSKSKRNKAIGRASVVPTFFGVNEPILFGAPIVLNPVFFIPFITAPIVNVWIFKFFVDVLGMNSFSVVLPWTTPGPLGVIMGTGFEVWAFVLALVLIVVDVLIYYPFFKVYDKQILEDELKGIDGSDELRSKVSDNFDTKKADAVIASSVGTTTAQETKADQTQTQEAKSVDDITEQTNVLVLCAGGGTSGLLANALNQAAAEHHKPVTAAAGSYGAHMDIMKEYDLVILAPQVASNYEDIKQDTDRLGIKLAKTQGAEYIKLTRDGEGALQFVKDQFK